MARPGAAPLGAVDSPYRRRVFGATGAATEQSDVEQACSTARLGSGGLFPSHYVARSGGGGLEVLELCVPVRAAATLVAAYRCAKPSPNWSGRS